MSKFRHILKDWDLLTQMRSEAEYYQKKAEGYEREAQKKHEDQEHFVTLVSFNSSETKKIYDCEPAAGVKELAADDYNPTSCTPLYDAMTALS